jgi:uncharacterized delta-60 repeat protein
MIPYSVLRYRIAVATALLFFITTNSVAIGFDSSFGSGGKFMTSFADTGQPSSSGRRVFLQPSGRIVVAGSHQQQGATGTSIGFALAGLTPGGLLDTNFGTGGKVVSWNASEQRFPTDFMMLSDGSIIVLHETWQSASNHRPVLIKLTPNGQADPAFQADLDIVANQTWPVRLAIASGGKIYVVVRNAPYQLFSLIRLNSDGSRDGTFGVNGVKSLNLNRFSQQTQIKELIEIDGGKLLMVGTYYDASFDGYTFVTRFDSDTNIDRSFGVQGVTRLSFPGGSVGVEVVKIQPDGKILLGGYWTFLGSNTYLARLTARGRLDHTFGARGIAMTTFNDWNGIEGMAIATDGKIILTGSSGDKALPSNQRLFVMRYSSAGVRESFLVTNFIGTREAGSQDVVIQPDGKIVIAGFTQNPSDTLTQLASARFIP